MKCAKCPFATKSNADGGNIRFCSGLQSRNVFAMSPMQLHTLVTNGPRPHYLDRLHEGESRRRRQGVAHTPSGIVLGNPPRLGVPTFSRRSAARPYSGSLKARNSPEYGPPLAATTMYCFPSTM